jgi:L-ascorbate metabolism protein UlaG (beta-lactamase superfamily)
VALDGLPAVDLVLLSHDHYDHLDYPTIRALRRSTVPFLASLGVGAHLEAWGVAPDRIRELDWWDRADLFGGEVVVTATPAQHFSGRGPGMRNHTLWSSFVIEAGEHRIFFGGDSGLMTGFAEIGDRFRPFDLVLLEIGAYHPAWANVHLGPANALTALQALGGGPLLPIHWGTFDLSTHRWDQPIEDLTVRGHEVGAELLVPRLGEATEPALARPVEPWWKDVAELHGPGTAPPDEAVSPPPPVD